jgi:hypothetical protein
MDAPLDVLPVAAGNRACFGENTGPQIKTGNLVIHQQSAISHNMPKYGIEYLSLKIMNRLSAFQCPVPRLSDN